MGLFDNSVFNKNFNLGDAIKNAWQGSWLERVLDPSAVEMRFNAQEAEKNREWNAEQARIARETEVQLSNTAIERGIADAQNSGINPYAVYSGGGASTPSISAASGSSASSNGGATSRSVISTLATVANNVTKANVMANRNATALAATALKILLK